MAPGYGSAGPGFRTTNGASVRRSRTNAQMSVAPRPGDEAQLEPLPDHQVEALEQLGDALELEVMAVALPERRQLLGVRVHGAAHRVELLEELLEACRGDDLEDPARLIPSVPEGVPLVARLEHEVTRSGLDNVVTEQRTHPPLQDVAVLVLACVDVQGRRQCARPHRVLDQREPLIGLVPIDHEPDPDAAQESCLAVLRADDLWCRRDGLTRLHVSFSLSVDSGVARNLYTSPGDLSRFIEQICPTKTTSVPIGRNAGPSSRLRLDAASPRARSSCTARSGQPSPR